MSVRTKRNENNQVVRYKERLVVQGFSERVGINFGQTYSPIIDGITFRYLISLTKNMILDMRLMDVMITYSYTSLNANIYMKIPSIPKTLEIRENGNRSMYNMKLQRSMYGIK